MLLSPLPPPPPCFPPCTGGLPRAACPAQNAEFAPLSRAGIPGALKDAMNPANSGKRPGAAGAFQGNDW